MDFGPKEGHWRSNTVFSHYLMGLDLYTMWDANRKVGIAVEVRDLQSLHGIPILGQMGHFGGQPLWI